MRTTFRTPQGLVGQPSGALSPVELVWKVQRQGEERRATLVRIGRDVELHLTEGRTRYFKQRYSTRAAALREARHERETLEQQGWRPAK